MERSGTEDAVAQHSVEPASPGRLLAELDIQPEWPSTGSRFRFVWGYTLSGAFVSYPQNLLIFSRRIRGQGGPGLTPSDHVLIAQLIRHERHKGQPVFPGSALLASRMGVTAKTVEARLRRLARVQLLDVRIRRGRKEYSLKPLYEEMNRVAAADPEHDRKGLFVQYPVELLDYGPHLGLTAVHHVVLMALLSFEVTPKDKLGRLTCLDPSDTSSSLNQIAERSGLARRTVIEAIRWLEDRGLVAVYRTPSCRNAYDYQGLRVELERLIQEARTEPPSQAATANGH
jgi:DNA-binding MarR family transcriptional regulator